MHYKSWFSKNASLETKMKMDGDLERIRAACAEIGDVHKRMRGVIHVAGTNGKGSTIAFLQSILKEAGFRVNSAISPHLLRINERIKLDGVDISDEHLANLELKYGEIADKHSLSFFERYTVMAFAAFAETDADFNIIEVGLGGTLDATNIIDCHKICVITAIDLDHCAILGNTVQEIAANKFGIIRPGDDVIISYQGCDLGQGAMESFFVGGRDWFVDRGLQIGLLGEHQYYNAGNAIAVCEVLKKKGYSIGEEAIKRGLMQTKWPARLQRIGNVMIDGAHNLHGVKALCRYLGDIDGPKVGVMAIMKDKDVAHICERVAGVFDKIYCVEIVGPHAERAMMPQDLCAHLTAAGIESAVCNDTSKLILVDLKDTKNVVVFGSLFLAGMVMGIMLAEQCDTSSNSSLSF